jgi:tetratricopeptide (TPR) repeat protein
MELKLENDTIPTLCLNMIVKNESKIITRLFDSLIPIIDCYCICDTGSTDNTIEIIIEYFKEKKKPGKVITEPFKNFCYNRTFALKACLGMSDFLILLDADMILEVKNFDKKMLNNGDSFTILQGNESFYYQNQRIIRNNGRYSYTGVTHEYINTPPDNRGHNIEKNALFITDVGDGGSKSDKFERDIKLLLQGIHDEPKNERYYFYLANSYHDSGRFGEAINVYKKRIELGGWAEEVWYSYYRIGLCYKNMGKIENAIFSWMEGYDFYPFRLEGLYEILHYYRVNSKHKLGDIIYKLARNILDKNLNRDNYLFLHNDIYTSKIYYEYTVFAAYTEVKNINYEIIKVFNNSRDDMEKNNLLTNMKFYKDILNQSHRYVLDSSFVLNINDENTAFTSSSSCLIPNMDNTGYYMNVRYVNYTIHDNGSYHNCENHIVSINKFLELDNNFILKNEKTFELSFDNRLYIGIEDVRIFNDVESKELLFIGTGFHNNNQIGIVNGLYDIDTLKLNGIEVQPNFTKSCCEKNWVFLDYNNSTHIIYDWYPVKICKMNEQKNELSLIEKREMPHIFTKVRGSTNGFKYIKYINSNNNGNISIDIIEEEIWFVQHIVSYENPRHYYHIISVFDSTMNLLRYSAPFKFEGDPIEYCLSIVVEEERVLINYSSWDRTTRIGVYDKKYIDSIVKYGEK